MFGEVVPGRGHDLRRDTMRARAWMALRSLRGTKRRLAAAPARGKCAAGCNANVGGIYGRRTESIDPCRRYLRVAAAPNRERHVVRQRAGIGYKLPCIVVEDFFIE